MGDVSHDSDSIIALYPDVAENAFRRLDRNVKNSMLLDTDAYRSTVHAALWQGHRYDRWAVLRVSFSPSDDQRIVVVPIRWIAVFRTRFLMVCVPNAEYVKPAENPIAAGDMPGLNWPFFPVISCPEGNVIYTTLESALAKRARIL